jgi:hypothetical protein
MKVDDDTNAPPIVWRSAVPDITACRTANPPSLDGMPDDGDIFALMPPPQQTIWPRVWPGL